MKTEDAEKKAREIRLMFAAWQSNNADVNLYHVRAEHLDRIVSKALLDLDKEAVKEVCDVLNLALRSERNLWHGKAAALLNKLEGRNDTNNHRTT